MDIVFDSENFFSNLLHIHSKWLEGENFGVDALLIAADKSKSEVAHEVTEAVHLYFFEYYLPSSVILCCESCVLFCTTKKKLAYLTTLLQSVPENFPLKINALPFDKTTNYQNCIDAVGEHLSGSFNGESIGVIDVEVRDFLSKPVSSIITSVSTKFVDVTNPLEDILASATEKVQFLANECASHLCKAIKFGQKNVVKVLGRNQNVTHQSLCQRINDSLTEHNKSGQFYLDQVNVHSGGVNPITLKQKPNGENIYKDIITVYCHGVYKGVHTYCARTTMLDASADQKLCYTALNATRKYASTIIKPGMVLGDLYTQLKDHFMDGVKETDKQPQDRVFTNSLKNYFGFVCNYANRYKTFRIEEGSERVITDNMVICIFLGLGNVRFNRRTRRYGILLVDTVSVTTNGCKLLTPIKADFGHIHFATEAYRSKAEDRHDMAHLDIDLVEIPEGVEIKGPLTRRKLAALKNQDGRSAMAKVIAHQNELADIHEQEVIERLRAIHDNGNEEEEKLGYFSSYPNEAKANAVRSQFTEQRTDMIRVDSQNNTVLVPIYGNLVPFHIETIKSCQIVKSDADCMVTIQLKYPSSTNQDYIGVQHYGGCQFIKTLSFRSANTKHMENVHSNVKTLLKRYKDQKTQRSLNVQLAKNEPLKMLTDRNMKRFYLRDTEMYPKLALGKCIGDVEFHMNGIRFKSKKGNVFDLHYNNVKHAVFIPATRAQPACKIVFKLKRIQLTNKKDTEYVTFKREIISEDSLSTAQSSYRSAAEEQRQEDQRRKRMVKEFHEFAKQVEHLGNPFGLHFDIPNSKKKSEFYGSPDRSSTLFKPTATNELLVSINSRDPIIIALSEIDCIFLQRFSGGGGFNQTFDMVIIWKDYNKAPQTISMINSSKADNIRVWLDSCNIKFFEYASQLKWGDLVQYAREDPESFIAQRGWRALVEVPYDESYEEPEDPNDPDVMFDLDAEYSDDEEYNPNMKFEEEEEFDAYVEEIDEGLDSEELERWAQEEDSKNTYGENPKTKRKPGRPKRKAARTR
ncbi:hypothetical protein PCE1_001804 [Barthelona sp. PCE]